MPSPVNEKTGAASTHCLGGCVGCPMSESDEGLRGWVKAHNAAAEKPLGGVGLVLRVMAAFVAPVFGALAGALWAGGGETERFGGLAAGFFIAAAASAAITGLFGRLRRRSDAAPAGKEQHI